MVYTRPKTVTHPGTTRARRALTSFMRRTPLTTTPRRRACAGCGGELTSASGELASPNYPQPYPHERDCRWYLSVEPTKRINITITDFDMEAHVNCSYDMLAVSISTIHDTHTRLTALCPGLPG